MKGSSRSLGDSLTGVIAAAVLVAGACWVLNVIDRHAKEHGHCFAYSGLSVERAEGLEEDRGGERGDVSHGCSVRQPGHARHVRSAAP